MNSSNLPPLVHYSKCFAKRLHAPGIAASLGFYLETVAVFSVTCQTPVCNKIIISMLRVACGKVTDGILKQMKTK